MEEQMKPILTSIAVGGLLATLVLAQSPRSDTVGQRARNVGHPECHPASALVYVITGGSQFGAVDLRSGAFLPIGPGTPPDVGSGLVLRPRELFPRSDSRASLLTLTFSGNLDAINPNTGKTSVVAATGLHDCSSPDSYDLKCANVLGSLDGTLYATDYGQNLYLVNPVTGKSRQIGSRPTGIPAIPFPLDQTHVYDQSLFSIGGKLYANFAAAVLNLNPDGSFAAPPTIVDQPTLYEINVRTGRAAAVGLITNSDGSPAIGLTSIVNVNGTIYGFELSTGQVVTLNRSNGEISPVTDLDSSAGLIGGAIPVQSVRRLPVH